MRVSTLAGLALAALLLTTGASAQQSFSICTAPAVRASFSNGVATPEELAQKNLWRVQAKSRALSAVTSDDSVLFYHEDDGAGDFMEVYIQKAEEIAQLQNLDFSAASQAFFSGMAGAAVTGPFSALIRGLISATLPDRLLSEARKRVTTEVAEDVAIIKEVLAAGDSLLVVAHSQGTLYSNEALLQLYSSEPHSELDRRVALISTGVAASSVVGVGGIGTASNYVTNTLDQVINALRLGAAAVSVPSPLLGNVTSVSTAAEEASDLAFQHSFKDVYFNEDLDAGQEVVRLMQTNLNRLSGDGASGLPSTDAYTFRIPLYFAHSVVDDFQDGPTIPVSLSGPYAQYARSEIRYAGPNSVYWDTTVDCRVVTALPAADTPMNIGMIFPGALIHLASSSSDAMAIPFGRESIPANSSLQYTTSGSGESFSTSITAVAGLLTAGTAGKSLTVKVAGGYR